MKFKYTFFNSNAKIPTRGTSKAAGYDLYAAENVVIPSNTIQIDPSWIKKVFDYITSCGKLEDITKYLTTANLKWSMISTGLGLAIHEGYFGRIAPRSGSALRSGIDVLAGIIDADYRGEIKVILINFGSTDFEIKVGDRIAQLIIQKHEIVEEFVRDDEEFVALTTSNERGAGGFGSTGKA